MTKYKKGMSSRADILTNSRHLLNEKGLGLTVDGLAKELGLTRWKITNYFATKESLLIAIMRDYEQELGNILQRFDWGSKGIGFEQLKNLIATIMDLQYEFRCAIGYLSVVSKQQEEMLQHIQSSFNSRLDALKMRLSAMVSQKLLQPDIVAAPHFEIFAFAHINLLTTWVISQEIYYSKKKYEEMKPIYLQSVLNLFIPYLTTKGKAAFQSL